MKVLGLVASPRRLGNSEIIVKEMMNLLPANWEKKMLQLNDLKIERCKACYACLPTDKRCIIQDDLNFFLDEIKAADKVIIAAPVYYLGQHTSLKLINDRMISVQTKSAEYFTGKQCVIAIPHTVPDWEGYAREATMHFARFLGLNVTGTAVINAELPGDAVNETSLTVIKKLARSLLDNSALALSDQDKAYCLDCGSSLLQIFHQGRWRCVMCAAAGHWTAGNGRFKLTIEPSAHRRYTLAGMEEHGTILNEVKANFISRRAEVAAVQNRYRPMDLWIKPEHQLTVPEQCKENRND